MEEKRDLGKIFVKCKEIIEKQLMVYDEEGEFSGCMHSCLPDLLKVDTVIKRKEILLKLNSENYAEFGNLPNYILSWTRDGEVFGWFYIFDYIFNKNKDSREKAERIFRTILNFYESKPEIERIKKAIKLFKETGKRQNWRDENCCPHPRLNPLTGGGIPADRNTLLQLDVFGQLLFFPPTLVEKGILQLNDEDVVFINKIVFKGGYLDAMEWDDFGIWEEGGNNKGPNGEDQKHIAEEHLSSIALLGLALKRLNALKEIKIKSGETIKFDIDEELIDRIEKRISFRLSSENIESPTRRICFGSLFALIFNQQVSDEQKIFSEEQEEKLLREILTLERPMGLIRYVGDEYNAKDGKEAGWPFGFGLLSIYYVLRDDLEKAEEYLLKLANTMTERGMPESYNDMTPIVLNPLGYPMVAFMTARLLIDTKKQLKEVGDEMKRVI